MHHIQDKKIDQLFKNQFEHAEMDPPAGLWASIEDQLEVKPVKRRFPVYWMAAAAALVLMTAGLLLNKPEKIRLQGPEPTVAATTGRVDVVPVEKIDNVVPLHKLATLKHTPRVVETKASGAILTANLKKDVQVMQPVHQDTRLQVVVEKLEPVVVSNQTTLASVQSSDAGADEVINENDQKEKRGIRNVGDLINYVVDKVDKREQKLLQFKTDDDDNSSLVAINIGFIKFNSKKHK